jgi:ADP-heptose:LPS heptosyltransferase
MINYLKEKLATFIVKRTLKHNTPAQQRFSRVFQNSSDFFLIMPDNETDFNSTFPILDFLYSHNKSIKIFLVDFRVALLPIRYRIKVFSYNINDINQLNLPSAKLVNQLNNLRFDTVIDLNREENLFSSFVSNLVESKFKIGMKKNKSNLYYNLIYSDSNIDGNKFYTNLLNFLKML